MAKASLVRDLQPLKYCTNDEGHLEVPLDASFA
jgi:hypothetical protein